MSEYMENVANIVQILVSAFFVLQLLFKSRHVKEKTILYFMAGGIFCVFLGNVFWTLFLIIRKELYPVYFSACDGAWLGGYLFLISVLLMCRDKSIRQKHPWWCYLPPILVILNAVKWVFDFGEPIRNGLWGIAMTMLAWYVAEGMWHAGLSEKMKRFKPFYWSVILFLLIELLLFSSAGIVYSVINFLLTLTYVVMPLALEKGVE